MAYKINNLWNTKEVCDFFGVTRQTVSNWVNKSDMPCYKVGPKTFKYDPILIQEWMNKRLTISGGK